MAIDRTVADPNRPNTDKSDFQDLVFQPKSRVRYANKTGETRIVILPAFADNAEGPGDPGNWTYYREDTEEALFTRWMEQIHIYSFVAKKANIISPKMFDRNAQDPMDRLLQAAKSSPAFYEICGLDTDGKRNTKDNDAFKKILIQRPDTMYVVNGIGLNPTDEADKGVPAIWTIKETAFTGARGSTDWGLLSQVRLTNRNVASLKRDSYEDYGKFLQDYYYWGDPTDVSRGMIQCRIFKAKGPNGGTEIFNMKPIEDAPLIQLSGDARELNARVVLEDALLQTSTADLVETLFGLFADFPKLLKLAFEGTYPGVDNMLRKAGIISDSRANQVGGSRDEDKDDDIPMGDSAPAPRSAAPAARTAAPRGAAPAAKPAEPAEPAEPNEPEKAPEPAAAPAARSFAPRGAARTTGAQPAAAAGKEDIQAKADRLMAQLQSMDESGETDSDGSAQG